MKDELSDKNYRAEFVAESVRNGIAFQIRALRSQRGWSQSELGKRSGKAQNVVSRIENPDYGSLTISTLLDVAEAFDVGLVVRFASFKEVVSRMADVSPKALLVDSFDVEVAREGAEQQTQFRPEGRGLQGGFGLAGARVENQGAMAAQMAAGQPPRAGGGSAGAAGAACHI